MMSKTIWLGALVASALLALPLAGGADSGNENGASGGGHGGSHDSKGSHGGSAAQSESLAGAWAALMAARDGIASDVDGGALGDIHAKSDSLSGLVAELVEQSGDLDAGKRARVEGAAKQVTRVAGALHVAADGGDAARTRKELSRLDGLLKLIRVQYPAGALGGGGHSGHGEGGHSEGGQGGHGAGAHDGHSAAPGPVHGAGPVEMAGAHAHMEQPAGVVDAAPQATLRIEALDRLRFAPDRIEVEAGVPTRIELVNIGAVAHSFVVKTPDGAQDWVHLHVPPGVTQAATYQLDTPGTYRVLCMLPGHEEGGMIGELVVLAGRADAHSHP